MDFKVRLIIPGMTTPTYYCLFICSFTPYLTAFMGCGEKVCPVNGYEEAETILLDFYRSRGFFDFPRYNVCDKNWPLVK